MNSQKKIKNKKIKKKEISKKKLKRKNFQNSKMSELYQCQCQTISVSGNVRI